MNILVWNREQAIAQVKDLTPPAAVISISTVGDELPDFKIEKLGIEVLFLSFDDVEDDDKFYTPISDIDALNIKDFIEENKDVETLVVHCDAGVSRSAAVAAAVGKYLFNDDMFIFGRPRFCPNRTVYRKVLKAFYDRELSEQEKVELAEKENWNVEIWRHFLFTTDNEEDFLDIGIIPIGEDIF